MIIWYVAEGLTSWSALRKAISGASDKMLWQHLRELERDGLLVRVIEGRRVYYALTAVSDELRGPLSDLIRWSEKARIGERVVSRSDERLG